VAAMMPDWTSCWLCRPPCAAVVRGRGCGACV